MLDHIITHNAGSSGYYTERTRGTIVVEHDSKKYIYRKPRNLRAFRREVLAAFESDGRCCAKLSGAYPYYSIETLA